MEPASPTLKETYAIFSRVVSVRQRHINRYVSGYGNTAVFQAQALGWFVLLEGSHEELFLGPEAPELAPGNRVKITIERITDAIPSRPSE